MRTAAELPIAAHDFESSRLEQLPPGVGSPLAGPEQSTCRKLSPLDLAGLDHRLLGQLLVLELGARSARPTQTFFP